MTAIRRGLRDESAFTLVELLVTIMILGIVMTGITSVVVTSLRTEQYQSQMQDVVDDGRLSMTRMRQEIRGARRVLVNEAGEGSTGSSIYFWVDNDQNTAMEDEELICYVVEAVDPVDPAPTQWRITRWSHVLMAEDCVPGGPSPAPAAPRVVASTLVSADPGDPTLVPTPFAYSPEPGGILDPPTREVTITLDLEVMTRRGPDSVQVEGSIRLRNVP